MKANLWKSLNLNQKLSFLLIITIGLPIIVITQVNLFLIPREEKKLIKSEIAIELRILEEKIREEKEHIEEESTQLARLIENRNLDINDVEQQAQVEEIFDQFTSLNADHSFHLITNSQGETIFQKILIIDQNFDQYPQLPDKPEKTVFRSLSVPKKIQLKDLPIVNQVFLTKQSLSGIELIESKYLKRLGLATQADIGIRPQETDNLPLLKKPFPEETYFIDRGKIGLVIMSVSPIIVDGEIVGTTITGNLLNRNYHIVDQVEEIAGINTATIFAQDWRISTNVPYESQATNPTRAIGTRVSRQVAQTVLNEKSIYLGQANIIGQEYYTGYSPIYDHRWQLNPELATPVGIAYVGTPLSLRENKLRYIIFVGYGIGAVMLLLTIFVIRPTMRRWLIEPILQLNNAAKNLAKGDWEQKIRLSRQDELGELATSFQTMAQQLQQSFQQLEHTNTNLESELQQKVDQLSSALKVSAKSQKTAEEANQAKSQFLANMSHELRTPLNAIIGYGEILIEDAQDLEQKEFIPDLIKIQSAGKHLLSLINDILDISKIEAGKMELFLEEFELKSLLEEIIVTAQPLIEKNQNQFELRYADEIGLIYADMTKFRQILFNLLSNASKFTQQGLIFLKINIYKQNNQDWLQIQVEDNGIGISNEQINQLFQPFTQADASTTRQYGGTGLGLTITKKFCEMMGGEIKLKSELGKGTIFTIELPVLVTAQNQPTEVSTSTPTLTQSLLIPIRENKVLVIDDDINVLDLMKRYLAPEGFDVITTTNPFEGIELARNIRPNVIILDVMMPIMDGWSVLNHLKSDSDLATIPVIMATLLQEQNLGYTLGATNYLTKPINTQELRKVLTKYRSHDSTRLAMVVDDDINSRNLLTNILQKEGWQVLEAINGEQALKLLESYHPQLLLLDLMMPEVDGFEVANSIQQNSNWQDIPIIIITAKDITQDDRQRLNGRVSAILQKGSYNKDHLLKQVRGLLKNITKK